MATVSAWAADEDGARRDARLRGACSRSALAAISAAHKAADCDVPRDSAGACVVSRRIRRELGTAPREAAPLLIAELRRTLAARLATLHGARSSAAPGGMSRPGAGLALRAETVPCTGVGSPRRPRREPGSVALSGAGPLRVDHHGDRTNRRGLGCIVHQPRKRNERDTGRLAITSGERTRQPLGEGAPHVGAYGPSRRGGRGLGHHNRERRRDLVHGNERHPLDFVPSDRGLAQIAWFRCMDSNHD